jgi:hypothetical protein
MKHLPNIEPSGFRRGEYVGYFDGPWRIVKVSGMWRAIHGQGKYWSVESRTLCELSTLLNNPSKA